MSCPKGQIRRRSFVRKDGTPVPGSCVTDRGLPGKGPKSLPLPKKHGFLSQYGYHLDISSTERHKALEKALAKEDDLEVMRHLNLIRNLTAIGTPNKTKLEQDVKFLSKKYKKSKSKSKVGGRRRSRKSSISRKRKSRKRTSRKRKSRTSRKV